MFFLITSSFREKSTEGAGTTEEKSFYTIKTNFKVEYSPQENVIFEHFKFNSIFLNFENVRRTGYKNQDGMRVKSL